MAFPSKLKSRAGLPSPCFVLKLGKEKGPVHSGRRISPVAQFPTNLVSLTGPGQSWVSTEQKDAGFPFQIPKAGQVLCPGLLPHHRKAKLSPKVFPWKACDIFKKWQNQNFAGLLMRILQLAVVFILIIVNSVF